MKKILLFGLLFCLALTVGACVQRIAPFSPHRPNTDFHRQAKTNHACIGCHALAEVGRGHQATDDCLRCHRIVQGD